MFTPNPVSHVTCHMSHNLCHIFFFFLIFFFFFSFFGPSGGAQRWRDCYQWGPPRLVYRPSLKILIPSLKSHWFFLQFLFGQFKEEPLVQEVSILFRRDRVSLCLSPYLPVCQPVFGIELI